jgi:ElaB/YqjD/DUF883 family membrane-anchored ribosome-binding protein
MAEGSDRSDEIRRATQGEDVGRPAPAVSEELKERARSGDEVAAARAEVEQARADITETVDAIQEKLEPQNLEKQVKARATDAARARGQQVLEAVKQNPMPAAVAGGVLCLLLARRLIRGRG